MSEQEEVEESSTRDHSPEDLSRALVLFSPSKANGKWYLNGSDFGQEAANVGLSESSATSIVNVLGQVSAHLETTDPEDQQRYLEMLLLSARGILQENFPQNQVLHDDEFGSVIDDDDIAKAGRGSPTPSRPSRPSQPPPSLPPPVAEEVAASVPALPRPPRPPRRKGGGGGGGGKRKPKTPQDSEAVPSSPVAPQHEDTTASSPVPPQSPNKRETRSAAAGGSVEPVEHALTGALDAKAVFEIKKNTVDALKEVQMTIKVNNVDQEATFKDSEAKYVVNAIYRRFDRDGLLFLGKVLQQAQSSTVDGHDAGVQARIEHSLDHDDLPDVATRLLLSYRDLTILSGPRNPELNTVRRNLAQYHFSRNYTTLCDAVSQDHPDYDESVRDEFIQKEWVPSQGRSWNSVILDFLASKAGVSRGALKKRIDSSQAMRTAIEVFGSGIVVLAGDSINSINDTIGVQKLRTALSVIADQNSAIEIVCDALTPWVQSIEHGITPVSKVLNTAKGGAALLDRLDGMQWEQSDDDASMQVD